MQNGYIIKPMGSASWLGMGALEECILVGQGYMIKELADDRG